MLYPNAMGEAFHELPEGLQRFHSVKGSVFYKGRVTVSHGGWLGRTVAWAGGMPSTSGEMSFSFRMTKNRDMEIWERNFGGHMTRSTQWLSAPGVIVEKVGSSLFEMEPTVRDGTLHIPITKITGFGLPTPRSMIISCEGTETVTEDGAITFDVHAAIKGVGLIVRYQGWLKRFPAPNP